MDSPKSALIKRLNGYWRMELGNVWLLPACIVWMAYFLEYPLGWLTWVSLIPMCGLLLIGGLYWRGKWQIIVGKTTAMQRVMQWVHFLQLPLAVGSVLAVVLCALSWLTGNYAASLGDRISASIAATLALLEYVNYYHRQLQHFDHAADWKRLREGKGFRVAQMAVDLRRFREGR